MSIRCKNVYWTKIEKSALSSFYKNFHIFINFTTIFRNAVMYDVNTMQFYGVDKTLLFEAVSEPRRKQPTQRRPTIIDGYTCWELAMVDADAVGRRFIELLYKLSQFYPTQLIKQQFFGEWNRPIQFKTAICHGRWCDAKRKHYLWYESIYIAANFVIFQLRTHRLRRASIQILHLSQVR